MLVLPREEGQDILIDGGIVITVVGFKGKAVKIGIKAPKHVKIYRRELFEAMQREGRIAQRVAHESSA